MKRILILTLALVLLLGLIGGTVAAAGGPKFKKATTGVLDEGKTIYYASHWAGATPAPDPLTPQAVKKYSGRIWEGYGEIEGIGKATVEVSACWDWGRGRPAGESNQLHTGDHRGALVVTTSQDFIDNKLDTEGDGAYTADATVTITDKKGDQLFGSIVGGSVYELVIHSPGPGSDNEWVINFEITGGTGKFAGATGTGIYRMVWDSNKESGAYLDSGYGDPARFLEQEIFLHLD